MLAALTIGYIGLPPDQKRVARSPGFWLSLIVGFLGYGSVYVGHGLWRVVGGVVALATVFWINRAWPAFAGGRSDPHTLRFLVRDPATGEFLRQAPVSELVSFRAHLLGLAVSDAERAPLLAKVDAAIAARGQPRSPGQGPNAGAP